MSPELLREISEKYLLPFFSGARLEPHTVKSMAWANRAAHNGRLSIEFKVNLNDRYRLVLTRPQPFTFAGYRTVTEIDVVRAFCNVLSEMETELEGPLKNDLLSTFQRRVVARALTSTEVESTVLDGIDRLIQWGNRLYEGMPISASIGFRNAEQQHNPNLDDIGDLDFTAVLSNGFDTILEFDYTKGFITLESLNDPGELLFKSPMRHAHIAEWTSEHNARIAMTLNRLGEILIFRERELIFARRAGHWHYLTHDPVISQMDVPRDIPLRQAIYGTCLDASFARTGACIGVVSVHQSNRWKSLISVDDDLPNSSSIKSKSLRKVIRGTNFANLDRKVRQELAAIDGATIISHTGQILAVGAILKVPGGSAGGGGRLAAAKALAAYGLGIKVSQDGSITGYRRGKTDEAFRIM
jgi:hypothetical protein